MSSTASGDGGGSPASVATPRPTSVAEDRDRQLAAAAWILGWVGGPVPALAILVASPARWARRLVIAAAAFWTMLWGLLVVLVYLGARSELPLFPFWWVLAVVVGLTGSVLGAWLAARRSQESSERRSW